MLAVIKDRKIFFPEYMVNVHNQGVQQSRDRYYNNFVFIAFNDAGNLPVLHNQCKSFRAPVINSRRMLVGINIDVMGGLNTVRVETSVFHSEDKKASTDILSKPHYSPVDIPIGDGEWNIVADYPALHDYCAALLHLGMEPSQAIAKTLSVMGHPNGNLVASIEIGKITQLLEKTYTKPPEETTEAILFDLIRPQLKSEKIKG